MKKYNFFTTPGKMSRGLITLYELGLDSSEIEYLMSLDKRRQMSHRWEKYSSR